MLFLNAVYMNLFSVVPMHKTNHCLCDKTPLSLFTTRTSLRVAPERLCANLFSTWLRLE